MSQCQCKTPFVLQGDENQLVDPRVIHVMLAEEEVALLHYTLLYLDKLLEILKNNVTHVTSVALRCCSVCSSWARTGGKGKMVK